MDWVIGIITGVVAGVISSIIFYLYIWFIKPKIIISDEICSDANEPNIYRIKVVNLSRFKAINLNYSLHYAANNGKSVTKVQKINPKQYELTYIDGYKSKKEFSDYAIRLTYEFDILQFSLNNELTKLVFVVYAEHSFSNKGKLFKKTFKLSNIKRGIFETGKSTRIISIK